MSATLKVQYRVSDEGCIMDINSRIIPPGTIITQDMANKNKWNQKWIDDAIRSGHVLPLTETRILGPDGKPVPNIPPIDPTATVGGSGDTPKGAVTITGGDAGRQITVTSTPPSGDNPRGESTSQVQSKWDIDPSTLTGQTLVQLNAMIQEREPTAPKMPTIEEARAYLSRDFKPQ